MPNVDVPPQNAGDPLGYVLGHHAPEIGTAAGGFVRSVYQSLRLPLRVAEAARYRTAQINGCLVCQDFRAGDHLDGYLASVGGDPSQSLVARGGARPDEAFYQAVDDWRNSDAFSMQERLAMDYSERLAENPRDLSYDADFWKEMRAAFTDAEITELTLAIGCWMAMGRFTHALGLDSVCMTDMLQPAA
ncbi:carboxymuconolactone decarboxylase family protein [Sphingobium sp. SCG-1]|uniref:carboxymuconolactone decarboxylase family protein n=1 Tax=Sphingobium sp. SCG-1 TaxID=2072936 RepID=UPI000CD681ED|nr:carboxymuconolactone decarboxylase family protein [Sphingobium sp. SCG-1]AUW59580.1 carboxymuconolactone decarboxylase family protein [Sphingobium sp. SCG-1]